MKPQLSGKGLKGRIFSPRTMMSDRSIGRFTNLSRSNKKNTMSRTSQSPRSDKKSDRFGSVNLQINAPSFFRKKRRIKRKTEKSLDVSKMNWSDLYRPVPLYDLKSPNKRYRETLMSPLSTKNLRINRSRAQNTI